MSDGDAQSSFAGEAATEIERLLDEIERLRTAFDPEDEAVVRLVCTTVNAMQPVFGFSGGIGTAEGKAIIAALAKYVEGS